MMSGSATLSVGSLLTLEVFQQATVVAGERGLERPIQSLQILATPDAARSMRGGELVLTTAFGFQDDPRWVRRLIPLLAEKQVAALIVAVGRYFRVIPPEMIEASDRLGFPLITLPWDLPFVQVTRAVFDQLVGAQYTLQAQSERIHATLTQLVVDGGGLLELAHVVSDLLGRSVTIEDASFELLAYANTGVVDSAREESVSARRTPEALVEALTAMGILKRLHDTRRPCHVEPIPELGMTLKRILAPVVSRRQIYGYVWLIAGEQEWTDLDTVALEHAATVTALIMLGEQRVHEVEARLRGDFFESLLISSNQQSGASLELATAGARLGLQAQLPHRVLLVVPHDPKTLPGELTIALERVTARANIPVWVILQGQRYVMLLEGQDDQAADELADDILDSLVRANTEVRVGMGGAYSGLESISESYREAIEAVDIARARDQALVRFDELGYLHWLYHLPPSSLMGNAYADRVELLAEHDSEKNQRLLETLEVYLCQGGNAQQTAKLLALHRNSLLYRLDRISEIINLNLSDPEVQVNLLLALRMRQIISGRTRD